MRYYFDFAIFLFLNSRLSTESLFSPLRETSLNSPLAVSAGSALMNKTSLLSRLVMDRFKPNSVFRFVGNWWTQIWQVHFSPQILGHFWWFFKVVWSAPKVHWKFCETLGKFRKKWLRIRGKNGKIYLLNLRSNPFLG